MCAWLVVEKKSQAGFDCGKTIVGRVVVYDGMPVADIIMRPDAHAARRNVVRLRLTSGAIQDVWLKITARVRNNGIYAVFAMM
jgi:hypothetical protein